MPKMQKQPGLMGDAGLHIQSCCVFAYSGLQWQEHLRATWYTTLPKARGQMKAAFDGGSRTHQHIQIPLLMPSRYERDTADIWEQTYEEREQIGNLISECMKPYFADIKDPLGRSPSTGQVWSMSVTERILLGFTSVTRWDLMCNIIKAT